MKMVWLIPFFLVFFSCTSAGTQYVGKDGLTYFDPKDYQVDPGMYPKYRAVHDFQPPSLLPNPYNEPHLRMPHVTTTDVWVVRHRIGNVFLIYSEEYAKRGGDNMEIAIFVDGRVLPGWKGIRKVLLKRDRVIRLTPDPHYDLSWGDQPLFIKQE
jgi:hypothetical protein